MFCSHAGTDSVPRWDYHSPSVGIKLYTSNDNPFFMKCTDFAEDLTYFLHKSFIFRTLQQKLELQHLTKELT